MDKRIKLVEEVFGYLYPEGFEGKFAELGYPDADLEFWYRNTLVYLSVTRERPLDGEDRMRLLTMIESARMEAMCPPPPGEKLEFDFSCYEFSEDIMLFKDAVVEEVLRQESKSLCPSFTD